MKINFNKGDTEDFERAELIESNFEGMLEAQKAILPDVEKNLNKIMKEYKGTMLCLVILSEDENGEVSGHREYITGVGGLKSQLALRKALDQAKESILTSIGKGIANNPKAGSEVLVELMTELLEDAKKTTKKGKR